MMQVRPPGTREWYNPDRDLLNNFHKFVKLALQRFERVPETEESIKQYNDAGIQTEQLKQTFHVAEVLRSLVQQCRDAKITAEELNAALKDLPSPVFDQVSRLIVEAFFEKYRNWQAEIGRTTEEE